MNFLSKIQEKLLLFLPFTITGIVLIFTLLTFFDFFEPYLYPLHMAQGKAKTVTSQCIVGPYPRENDLQRLQSKLGVTHIVSLLDTNDLPQEKALFMKEKKICKKYHLTLSSVPLSYFSLESYDNQNKIDALIRYIHAHPNEKFYIHCYLGKHRAGKVANLLSHHTMQQQ